MRSSILANIVAKILENGQRLITGPVLQEVLTDMVNKTGVLGEDAGLRDFSATRTYYPGDTCLMGGVVLRANEETTGAFNASLWTVVAHPPVVADITARNAISFRFEGMLCYVVAQNTSYQLVGGLSNDNWVVLGDAQVHRFLIQPAAVGQTTFTVPDREILTIQVNGVEETGRFDLQPGNGTTRSMVWQGTENYVLRPDDEITLLYKGNVVTL